MHVHFHVVPRFEGDDYWNAATPEIDSAERERQAAALRSAIAEIRG